MKARGVLIALYIIMHYVIYGILGELDNSFWNAYNYFCPVMLVVGSLIFEIKDTFNGYLKFWYVALIAVAILYFARIAFKFDINHDVFMSRLNPKAVYWTPVFLAFAALISILKIKIYDYRK